MKYSDVLFLSICCQSVTLLFHHLQFIKISCRFNSSQFGHFLVVQLCNHLCEQNRCRSTKYSQLLQAINLAVFKYLGITLLIFIAILNANKFNFLLSKICVCKTIIT